MPDVIEHLSRYGAALEVHQSKPVLQPMRPDGPRPTRRHRPVLAIAATILLIGLAIGATALSADRDSARITTTPTSPGPVPSTGIELNRPEALAVAPDGSLLIANQGTDQILRRTPGGVLSVVAGNPTSGSVGDGGKAVDAALGRPGGMAVAADGTIYVAEIGANRVRRIAPDGVITTIAGNGTTGPSSVGVPATDTAVVQPWAVALRADGGLYVVDDAGVQVISPKGILTTVVAAGMGSITVNGTATDFNPSAIAVDRDGNLFVASFSVKYVVEFSPTGQVLHLWENVYATASGLATAPDGSVLVGEYGGFTVVRLSDGTMTTVADFLKDKVPGVSGTVRPSGVVAAADGSIYVATDGVSGTTSAPALVVIEPDAAPRHLPTAAVQAPPTAAQPPAPTAAPFNPGSDGFTRHDLFVRRLVGLVLFFGIPTLLGFALGLTVRRPRWLLLVPAGLALVFAFYVSFGSLGRLLAALVSGLIWALLGNLGMQAGAYVRRRLSAPPLARRDPS